MQPRSVRDVKTHIAYIRAGSPFGPGFRRALIWDLVGRPPCLSHMS